MALYAARERDRRALMLYGILVGAGILMDLTYLVGGAAVSWLAVGFAIVQLGLKLAVRLGPSPHRRSPSCLSQSPHRPAYTAPNLHRSNRPSCHRATWAQARGTPLGSGLGSQVRVRVRVRVRFRVRVRVRVRVRGRVRVTGASSGCSALLPSLVRVRVRVRARARARARARVGARLWLGAGVGWLTRRPPPPPAAAARQ